MFYFLFFFYIEWRESLNARTEMTENQWDFHLKQQCSSNQHTQSKHVIIALLSPPHCQVKCETCVDTLFNLKMGCAQVTEAPALPVALRHYNPPRWHWCLQGWRWLRMTGPPTAFSPAADFWTQTPRLRQMGTGCSNYCAPDLQPALCDEAVTCFMLGPVSSVTITASPPF